MFYSVNPHLVKVSLAMNFDVIWLQGEKPAFMERLCCTN